MELWGRQGAGLSVSVMASEAYSLAHSRKYDTYAQRWLADILGANAWLGVVLHRGRREHVSELHSTSSGESGGRSGLNVGGAASEGPSSCATSGALEGMILGPANGVDTFKIFNGSDGPFGTSPFAEYQDNMQSYSTTEPAVDLTSTSFLMWSWRLAGHPDF